MDRSCTRKLSRSSLKLPKTDKTIELIQDIISNVSPLKISDIIRESIAPPLPQNQVAASVSCSEEQECKKRGRKLKLPKKQAEPQAESSKRKIKVVKKEKEVELLCIPREEYERDSATKRIRDILNKRKKYSTTSNENSFQCSPIKEPSISGCTVTISDDEESYNKEPVKKLKISNFPRADDSKEQVSFDMQKEFGNTLSELGERLKNLTTLGNSMKTLSFLQHDFVQKEDQQHEPLEILNDFYSKVKKLYVEFGENLNQSK